MTAVIGSFMVSPVRKAIAPKRYFGVEPTSVRLTVLMFPSTIESLGTAAEAGFVHTTSQPKPSSSHVDTGEAAWKRLQPTPGEVVVVIDKGVRGTTLSATRWERSHLRCPRGKNPAASPLHEPGDLAHYQIAVGSRNREIDLGGGLLFLRRYDPADLRVPGVA